MSSERRVLPEDYPLVRSALHDLILRLRRDGRKSIYPYLDLAKAMRYIRSAENAWIVADGYLVVFELDRPWFSDALILNELLVVRLAQGPDFSAVPDFLGRKAEEAGATMVMAGTALAKSDRALASLYAQSGFSPQGTTLLKEI